MQITYPVFDLWSSSASQAQIDAFLHKGIFYLKSYATVRIQNIEHNSTKSMCKNLSQMLNIGDYGPYSPKSLTPWLTHKLCNPLDDWLDRLIPTKHRMDYIIRRSTQELKV